MSDFIMSMSQVMRAEVKALDSIAQNSANVNTVGYKSIRSATAGAGFAAELESAPSIATKISTAPGKVSVTERPLDFAIMGSGWFGVQHKDSVMLTRNGSFALNSERVLTTQAGHPVLGVDGPVRLDSEPVEIEPNGTLVTADGNRVQLALYVTDGSEVTSIGDNLYASKGKRLAQEGVTLVQGALEESNVDSAADMVRLMEVSRHIESMQRAISTYNDLLSTGINEIGK